MSGATTKKYTASTTITKQEIRCRLRGMMKQVKRLMKAGIGLNSDHYRLLLEKGEFFVDVTATKNDPVVHAYVHRYRPKSKECFYNCQQFILDDSTRHATYHEGFVTAVSGILVHHAWLVVGGAVFDPTLEAADRVLVRRRVHSEQPSARRYFGVPFPPREVAEGVASGVWGPLLTFPFATL